MKRILQIALLAATAVAVWLNHSLAVVRSDVQAQYRELADVRQREQDLSTKLGVCGEELVSRVKEHDELMRVRAELSMLRLNEKSTPGPALGKVNETPAASSEGDGAGDALERAQLLSRHMVNSGKLIGLVARIYSSYSNDDELPTRLDQIQELLPARLPGNTESDRFEFVNQGRPLTTSDPNAMLLREREPRQRPDGSWARVYSLADGTTVEKTSLTGDFSRYERDFLVNSEGDK